MVGTSAMKILLKVFAMLKKTKGDVKFSRFPFHSNFKLPQHTVM